MKRISIVHDERYCEMPRVADAHDEKHHANEVVNVPDDLWRSYERAEKRLEKLRKQIVALAHDTA